MSTYVPDRWVMLEFNTKGETMYKILAGWSGSYTHGESWKLNSGITEVKEDEDYFYFSGYSGSVYKCHKRSYGVNSMTSAIYCNWMKQISEENMPENTMVMLPENTDFMRIDYGDDE